MRWLTSLLVAALLLAGIAAPATAAPDGTLTLASTALRVGEPVTATLPTDGLEPGNYIVFALAQDGYQWLAAPVKLRIASDKPPAGKPAAVPNHRGNDWPSDHAATR